MPHKGRKAKNAYQRQWARRNRKKVRQINLKSAHKQRHQTRDKDNEQYFRFSAWEMFRVSTSPIWELFLHTGTALEMANPMFVFDLRGERSRETLLDPLPKW